MLDLRQGDDQAQWVIVPVIGTTPGRRYGHVMTFSMPYLLVFGGNTGTDPANDVWFLSIEKAPFSWAKIVCNSELPPARVYHAAAQCFIGSAAGMMIIFGGRTNDQSALNDTWGLRRHRDCTWDWVKAPYKPGIVPLARYQHTTLFINSVMVVVGGRANQVTKVVPFETYDTETSEWFSYPSIKRFRHACWAIDGLIYLHGGFEQESPNVPTNSILKIDSRYLFRLQELKIPNEKVKEETKGGGKLSNMGTFSAAPSCIASQTLNKGINNSNAKPTKKTITKEVRKCQEEKVFKLSNQALVAASLNLADPEADDGDLVRSIFIDKLPEESKKIGGKSKAPIAEYQRDSNDPLYSLFINNLLKPKELSVALPGNNFPFKKEHVIELAKECQAIIESQPNLLKLRTPVKIFGNLHGNFQDLMRFFDVWKAPNENPLGGDIDSFAYLFLGNYVDRGSRSLETICLLLALKLKYPDQIYLLRGSHEDRLINSVYGFGEECKRRLHEDINDPNSAFQSINNAFAWFPFGALIENKILCVHSGIGPNLTKLDDIAKINRPIEMSSDSSTSEQEIMYNALWSYPNETKLGYQNMPCKEISRNAIKYGKDKVEEFIRINNLEMIIRGHENIMEGFETFADGRLLTITSCTDYCGKLGNSASIMVVPKTFDIVPKLLLPETNPSKKKCWTEDEDALVKYPPTPLRVREKA